MCFASRFIAYGREHFSWCWQCQGVKLCSKQNWLPQQCQLEDKQLPKTRKICIGDALGPGHPMGIEWGTV